MSDLPERPDQESALRDVVAEKLGRPISSVTPARVFLGHVDGSYRTETLLRLGADQALARRAVARELDLDLPEMAGAVDHLGLYEVRSQAESHDDHLARPFAGRQLSTAARERIAAVATRKPTIQLVVGDGLSAGAVHRHAPFLLKELVTAFTARGWTVGRPVAVRHCRVGVMGDIGPLTGADVVVLLIGERPGLATPESLSIYLQWRPAPDGTDADRNVIANIHDRGLSHEEAVHRAVALVDLIRAHETSGLGLVSGALAPGEHEEGI